MTFEEWKKQRDIELDDAPISAQEIWEAATKAEREACAQVCDMWNATNPERLAREIRKRSNLN